MAEDYELKVTRPIAAPRDVVWRAMTERMAEWWCPKPWRVEIIECDLRAGGRSSMVMHGPGGEAWPMEGVFLEVTPGERLVFTDAFEAGWKPAGPFMVGIMSLADEGDGTLYTGAARHWTEDAYKQHQGMEFDKGWTTVAGQLAEIAEAMARG